MEARISPCRPVHPEPRMQARALARRVWRCRCHGAVGATLPWQLRGRNAPLWTWGHVCSRNRVLSTRGDKSRHQRVNGTARVLLVTTVTITIVSRVRLLRARLFFSLYQAAERSGHSRTKLNPISLGQEFDGVAGRLRGQIRTRGQGISHTHTFSRQHAPSIAHTPHPPPSIAELLYWAG